MIIVQYAGLNADVKGRVVFWVSRYHILCILSSLSARKVEMSIHTWFLYYVTLPELSIHEKSGKYGSDSPNNPC